MKNWSKIIVATLFVCAAFYFPAQAQTNVSGGIYANTTWTLAHSPYIITDTVVVFPGDTLTIQPGVVVKFDSTVFMEIRQATLIANGTAALPITFKANSTNAGRTFWSGIYLNSIDTIVYNNCKLTDASNGLFGGWLKNTSLTFKNNTFSNNQSGFVFSNSYASPNRSWFFIDSSSFNNNDYGLGGAYFVDLGNLFLSNCSFNNNYFGLYSIHDTINVNQCSFNGGGGIGNFTRGNITNCVFNSNTIGVSTYQYTDYVNILFCKFRNCYEAINDTNSSGINYFPISVNGTSVNKNYKGIVGTDFSITNCVVDSNSFVGISNLLPYHQQPSGGNYLIENSVFKFNNIAIISSSSKIKQNIIDFNVVGINGSIQDTIVCNHIANNSQYNFYYNNTTSNANYHIGKNDWGDTSIAQIRAKIYDGYTNISLGLVNFLPIDTAQCYLSACNLVLTPTVTNATCDTCHNGKISVQTSGGGAPYHYTWYTSPLQTTATISNVKTGKYHFCVTDVRGCAACDTVFVDSVNCNAFHTTTKTIAATCATCNDGSAKITHSLSNAPYLFAWNTLPVQNTDSATTLNYGTHIGCVTDHNNCQSCDTVFIDSTRCKNFAVQLTSTAVSCKTCNDGKAFSQVIAGTAPYTFSWNTTPVTTIDSITNQHFGMYTLHVTDANSCAATDSIYVDSVNCTGFAIYTFADSVSCNTCNNGKAWVHAQGGVMPYNYYWNTLPINLSDTIKNQHQGIYQVCVKDNQGCQLCQNVLIDSFNCGNMLVNAYGKNTTCGTCTNGAAWAVATGGATPYTYLWNTAQTTDSIKNISIGNYIITATDWHGCKSVDTIQIDSTLCFGFHATEHHFNPTCATCTDGVAWLTVNGGQQPYHYTWFTSPLQNSTSVNNLGIGTYTVCVNDANTCTMCDTIILNQYCSAQFIINPDTIPHHYFAVNMASGAAPIAYTWYWGDGASDTGVTPNHVYATAGFYTICLSIVDANNCTQTYCDSFYLMRMKNSMISLNVIKEKKINTGVEQLAVNEERLMVYPNPANEWLIVNGKSLIGNTKIEVTDLLGQVVLHPLISSSSNLLINVVNLPSSIYFLKATDENGLQHVAKFVKE